MAKPMPIAVTAFLLAAWFLSTAVVSTVDATGSVRGASLPSSVVDGNKIDAISGAFRNLQDKNESSTVEINSSKKKKKKKKNKKGKKKKKDEKNQRQPDSNTNSTLSPGDNEDDAAGITATDDANSTTNSSNATNGTTFDPDLELFIIGGATAQPNAYPFYAHRFYSNSPAGCGGSLIAQNWVLTAAHCLDTRPIRDGFLPAWRVGSYCHVGDVENNCGARSTMTQTVKVVIHPSWSPSTLSFDMGLAQLDRVVNESPVAIDDGSVFNKLEEGDEIKSIGMGYINDQFELADYLQEVTNYFFPPERCYPDQPSIMCTNGRNVGTCRGDSGSPNLYRESGVWKQVGITSFGRAQCENHDAPDGLARVATVHRWIVQNVCPNYLGDPPAFCGPNAQPKHPPTPSPTAAPQEQPTLQPTENPTIHPTNNPTLHPTLQPTQQPTMVPTRNPTSSPTEEPTHAPTRNPIRAGGVLSSNTGEPSPDPTHNPTRKPSPFPTVGPSPAPSSAPTVEPTHRLPDLGNIGGFGGFGRTCKDRGDFNYGDQKRLCSEINDDRTREFFCSRNSDALRWCAKACGSCGGTD